MCTGRVFQAFYPPQNNLNTDQVAGRREELLWGRAEEPQPQEVSVALWKRQRKVSVALEENLTQEGG